MGIFLWESQVFIWYFEKQILLSIKVKILQKVVYGLLGKIILVG